MAATIATAIGRDKRPGMGTTEKEATRLGASQAEGKAQTFKTFTVCVVNADGSGFMRLDREIQGKRETVTLVEFSREEGENKNVVAISGGGSMTGRAFIENEESAYTQSMREFDHKTNGGAF